MKIVSSFEKYLKAVKTVFLILVSFLSIYCVIFYSKECSNGIISGLSFCIGVLIPSLFLFMVLSSFIAYSSVADILAGFLKFPTRIIFKLPKSCSVAILMSLIGGYPVGARYVYALYDSGSISVKTAKRLSMFTVCSGPGFVLNYIGNALLNSRKSGVILLISQVTATLLTGVIVALVYNKDDEIYENDNRLKRKVGIGNLLVKSVSDGCSATVSMCSMVVVFSAIISVCDKVLINHPVLSDIVCAFLEVTTACNRMCGKYPLTVISFVVGFGGICVHFQIFSALRKIDINKGVFFLFRIIQGIISAAVTYILLMMFNDTKEVFSTASTVYGKLPSSVFGSAALLLVAVCFLGSLNYSQLKRR